MIRIPEEELNAKKIGTDMSDSEIYHTYLKRTDADIINGFETLLASTSLTAFFTNLKNLNTTLRDTVNYRAIAREEINNTED